MIIKLGTVQEANTLKEKLDEQLWCKVIETATILDESYGDRNIYTEMGGYIVIVETGSDLLEYKKEFDYLSEISEFTELIKGKEEWVQILYLLSSDFGITLYVPKDVAPIELLKNLEVDNNEL